MHVVLRDTVSLFGGVATWTGKLMGFSVKVFEQNYYTPVQARVRSWWKDEIAWIGTTHTWRRHEKRAEF
jgi:hypothetical protein